LGVEGAVRVVAHRAAVAVAVRHDERAIIQRRNLCGVVWVGRWAVEGGWCAWLCRKLGSNLNHPRNIPPT
jgi:hypothetical protein